MIKELNSQAFHTAVSSDRLSLVDFNAQWCGPCRMLSPILENLSEKTTDVDFYSVDIDKEQQLAINNGIEVVPTVMLFRNGEKLDISTGLKNEKDMLAFIQSNMK